MIRLLLPIDPFPMSPNRSLRRGPGVPFQINRLKQQAAEVAYWAWQAAGKPTAKKFPVRLDVIVRRQRVMDDDNVIGALKSVRDCLFKKGRITPDDSPQYLQQGSVTFETGKVWRGRAQVELLIVEPD